MRVSGPDRTKVPARAPAAIAAETAILWPACDLQFPMLKPHPISQFVACKQGIESPLNESDNRPPGYE